MGWWSSVCSDLRFISVHLIEGSSADLCGSSYLLSTRSYVLEIIFEMVQSSTERDLQVFRFDLCVCVKLNVWN